MCVEASPPQRHTCTTAPWQHDTAVWWSNLGESVWEEVHTPIVVIHDCRVDCQAMLLYNKFLNGLDGNPSYCGLKDHANAYRVICNMHCAGDPDTSSCIPCSVIGHTGSIGICHAEMGRPRAQ